MIYCEPIPDDLLDKELLGTRSSFIVGCSLCANIGYCISNRLRTPVYTAASGAINTKNELKRLSARLSASGFHTDTHTLLSLCFLTKGQRRLIRRKAHAFETVVALSCDIGRQNLAEILPGKHVIAAMKNKGFMRSAVYPKGLSLYIDPDRLYINNTPYPNR